MNSRAPAWLQELLTMLPVCSNFLVSGNVHDVHWFGPSSDDADTPTVGEITELLQLAFADIGMPATVCYDMTTGATVHGEGPVHELLQGDPASIASPGSLNGLSELIRAVLDAVPPVPLVIKSASRLVRDLRRLEADEFEFFRAVDNTVRASQPSLLESGRSIFSPVVWILDQERAIPAWFPLGNKFVRSLVVPLPEADERREFARFQLEADLRLERDGATDEADADELDERASELARLTVGLPLSAILGVIAIHGDQSMKVDQMEDAARTFRIGVVDNPWHSPTITTNLRAELAASGTAIGLVRQRVIGQELAIERSLDILARSVAGLTAAHAGPVVSRPRGVLFFAGPTGVGKTELAKALTTLLFGDERYYIRFDMSEFAAEHASDRLIGAPPGYVGFEAGGELTNAVRQRPFSIILFDEIEKAHPKILDKFLQILDDGRLTDGRGDTSYFTEAVIVFTSNLGVMEERERREPDGSQRQVRVLLVDPDTTSYEDMAPIVEQAVRDHFTLRLGRPELLNRIGENIVVFDFIRRETGMLILHGMIQRVLARVADVHSLALSIDESSQALLEAACLDKSALLLGGRGVGARLEYCLVNPLSRVLVQTSIPETATLHLETEGQRWIATLR